MDDAGVQFPPVEVANDANRKENPQGEGTTVAGNLGITTIYRRCASNIKDEDDGTVACRSE